MKTTTFVRVIGERLMWAFFPLVTTLLVADVSPLWTAGISTVFAALAGLFFFPWSTFRNEVKTWPWGYILGSTILIGVVMYALVFTALKTTTVGNVTFLSQFQIPVSYLLAVYIFHEKPFAGREALGALLLFISVLWVVVGGWSGLVLADWLVILGAVITPLGNVYAQKALKVVDGATLLTVRQWISALFLCGLAYVTEPLPAWSSLSFQTWMLLILNGVLLLGLSKWLFYKNLEDLGVARVSAFFVLSPPLALLLAWVFLGQVPPWNLWVSLVFLVLGMWIMKGPRKNHHSN